MTNRVRRACRWSLYYSGRWFCKLPAIRSPGKEPPMPLDDGCPKTCADLDVVPWKKDLYGDEYEDDDELPPPLPRVVEWDEET